ncbi:response regulator [Rhodomicrobium sp. Az07]|uniref:response regulator n=1 Tax=Rhodomicrobium sp. Az07 TaxID=2839034 RepID=UPI001BE65B92|nr:response regulator [Rhodomicrobium sp. Az07]MBT3070788.1 response regulator [Rhodomicrobium sp. Az07]
MMEQQKLAGARVLIVEDDALSALVAQEMLAELGCSVTGVAVSVDQALAEINRKQPLDCVMLDVRLGRELSSDIATYLLQQNLPFIICSGYDIKLPGMNIPVVDKPYTVAALAQALSRAITQKVQ